MPRFVDRDSVDRVVDRWIPVLSGLDPVVLTMTSRVDALMERGFVRRRPSTTDRRKVVVELTGAGYQAWRGAIDGIGDEESRLMGALSPDEQRQLADLLRPMLLLAEADAPTRPVGP